jgi:ribosomal-protein-alanine N-acetyltransferase
MTDGVGIRLLTVDDADALGKLYEDNLHLFSADEPSRARSFFTVDGQRIALAKAHQEHRAGRQWPGGVVLNGELVGKFGLYNIQRGHIANCSVGGWIASAQQNQGIATAAVREILVIAFEDLGLHKVEGYAKLDNVASRRMMELNEFREVGVLRRHVYDRGRWHDQVLYERIAPWCDGTRPQRDE